MTIALDLSQVGSISTYSQLVDAVRDMMDDEDYKRDAIDQAIRKVEAHLNRELRTPDMERFATLTLTGPIATLPDNFLELRAIRHVNDPCGRELKRMSSASLRLTYGDQQGFIEAYSSEGLGLRFGPSPNNDNTSVDVVYIAAIQPLTEDVQNNWVLDKHADVYVSGVLYHLARRERDVEGEQSAGTEYLSIIEAIKRAGMSARWGAGPIVPQGIAQVHGVRA